MQPPSVLIGRFQPFHVGHARLLAAALEGGGEVVVVLGSHGRHRSPRNPFLSEEREAMMRSTLDPADQARVHFVGVADHLYDEARWRAEVVAAVEPYRQTGPVRLVGLRKDGTSAYLEGFPAWSRLEAPGQPGLSGCYIRAAWFEGREGWDQYLAPSVQRWLAAFRTSGAFAWLRHEHLALRAYQEKWTKAPYPPVLVTVDTLVLQGGCVLLVRRGKAPGKGTLALPGGFLDSQERLAAAARRELGEETGLQLAEEWFCPAGVFDHPLRSERGRMVSHVFRVDLPDGSRPAVAGGDDAASAQWVPLCEALAHPDRFFDDHHDIISLLTAMTAQEIPCPTLD